LLLVGWSASLLSLQGGSNAVAAGLDLLVGKLSPIDSPPLSHNKHADVIETTPRCNRLFGGNDTLQENTT
jgi:hypothetical protein